MRWVFRLALGHQQLKEELGLDHFEGRSWQGLHRHALLGTNADYLFLDVAQSILAEEDLVADEESRTAKRAARD